MTERIEFSKPLSGVTPPDGCSQEQFVRGACGFTGDRGDTGNGGGGGVPKHKDPFETEPRGPSEPDEAKGSRTPPIDLEIAYQSRRPEARKRLTDSLSGHE